MTTKEMTWMELNDQIDGMLPDIIGPAYDDMLEMGFEDEPVFACNTLNSLISALEDVTSDQEAPEDYSTLITQLKEVR